MDKEDEDFIAKYQCIIDDAMLPHIDAQAMSTGESDPYINVEVGLYRTGEEDRQRARVKRRTVDAEGIPIGTPSNNPLLDHRQYEVEYLDGETETITANIIAENILAQVDNEGHRQLMLQEIIDHHVNDDAIPKEQGHVITKNRLRCKVMTTRGWELHIEWKDGSTNWVALKDLKESYPIEVAEYACWTCIDDEPAFAWWVKYALIH